MKLQSLIFFILITGSVYATRDKELTAYSPTVGQALIRAIKNKFSGNHAKNLKDQLKQNQMKADSLEDSLVDAQLLLHPDKHNFTHDVV